MRGQDRFAPEDEAVQVGNQDLDEVGVQETASEKPTDEVTGAETEVIEGLVVEERAEGPSAVDEDGTATLETTQAVPRVAETRILEEIGTQPKDHPSQPPEGEAEAQPKKSPTDFKTRMKRALESMMEPPVFWIVLGLAAAGLVLAVLLGVLLTNQSAEVSALEAEVDQQQAEVADWKNRLTEAEKQNESLSAEVGKIDRREMDLRKQEEELEVREEEAAEKEAELAALEEKLAERESAVSGAEAKVAKNSFGSGMYLVGSDIQPGTYRSGGGDFCYWERLSGTGGSFSEIIANDISDGPSIVTISPTDVAFDSSGCGTWTPAD